jgi:hypothetical protein
MKRVVVFSMLTVFLASLISCGPKPYYKTLEGKRKQKYYNAIQFGADPHPKKKF